jgi:hypothetical protein
LTITSNGLDRSFNLVNGADADNDFIGTEEDAYADSSLQMLAIDEHESTIQLPFSPLHLSIQPAPICGQCRDLNFDDRETDCNLTPLRQWDSGHGYCVVDDGLTNDAQQCDALANSRWMAVYGATSCVTPRYNFVASDDFCARPIHIAHGLIGSNSHKTSDATSGNISGHQSDDASAPTLSYLPDMETTEATPVAGLTLPPGQMRVGLFVFDNTASPQCTNTAYPSASAQARSDSITLSSHYAPNIGTAGNPIVLRWRSQ